MPAYPEDLSAGSQVSDHSLMRRLRLGSEDAATQIYLRYAYRLRALARSQSSPELARCVDADEMVQSVFGSFFRGAKNGYYDVPVGEELWRLFLVIALNKIRAKGAFYHAAKRDVRMTSGGALLEQCAEVAHDDTTAAMRDLQLSIDEALESLPSEYREMVLLRIEGYRVEEIADRMKRSKRSVERMLQEVRKKLAYFIDEA
jgi:RNA polymerase sigma-70 factor, ECF subfamily